MYGLDIKESCGDLKTSRSILSVVAAHSHVALIGILSKNLTGLCGSLFHAVPWGLETSDGHSESCYQGMTKAKTSSDVLGPKTASEAIAQHQIRKKIY